LALELGGQAHGFGLDQVAGDDADGAGGAGSVAAGEGEIDALVFDGVEYVAIFWHLEFVVFSGFTVVNPHGVVLLHGGGLDKRFLKCIFQYAVISVTIISGMGLFGLADKFGEMAEWLKAQHWKCCVGVTLPRVRIPLSPF
jgi:hypothetical protein